MQGILDWEGNAIKPQIRRQMSLGTYYDIKNQFWAGWFGQNKQTEEILNWHCLSLNADHFY